MSLSQRWSENIKQKIPETIHKFKIANLSLHPTWEPQPLTSSVPDIDPWISPQVNDPGSPETDDAPTEVSSEKQ